MGGDSDVSGCDVAATTAATSGPSFAIQGGPAIDDEVSSSEAATSVVACVLASVAPDASPSLVVAACTPTMLASDADFTYQASRTSSPYLALPSDAGRTLPTATH